MALTNYELERARNIARNNAKLAELDLPRFVEPAKCLPRKKKPKAKVSDSGAPRRRSTRSAAAETTRRLRATAGHAGDEDDSKQDEDADDDDEAVVGDEDSVDEDSDSGSLSESSSREATECEATVNGRDESQDLPSNQANQPAVRGTKGKRGRVSGPSEGNREGKGKGKGKKAGKARKQDILADIDIDEAFVFISGGRGIITTDDVRRVAVAHKLDWNPEQIRDMLLDLTDESGRVFDDGTAAEELQLDRAGFGQLHQAIVNRR